MAERDRTVVTPRFVLGVWIALMGVVLMLDRIGIVDAGVVFRLWPVVIIAAGWVTYSRGARSGHTNGVVVMVLGAWLLLNTLGVIRIGIWDMFWPLVLIAAGSALIMQTLQRGREPAGAGEDRVMMFAVLGGMRRSSTSQHFRGGDVAAFMGGGRLDLRQAGIPAGEEAVLDVLAVMGGFELFVPPNWVVATPILPFMGSVEDHRLAPAPAVDAGTASSAGTAAPRLVIRGFLMMGGIHIRTEPAS